MMMLAGFGAAGFALRRSRRRMVLATTRARAHPGRSRALKRRRGSRLHFANDDRDKRAFQRHAISC